MATPILGLPELAAAQNQKHLTVNSALSRLDVLVNLTVFNRTVTSPPGSPSEGHRYIVAAPATGAFAGQQNKVAAFIGSNWIFFTPSEGWRVYDQGANESLIFDGTAWVASGLSESKLSDGSLNLLGVAATPDATNRLSVRSPGVLFNRETNHFTLTMNKQATANNLQTILQTNFSTRAIFGLLGDDHLAFRVSPDGSSFFDALKFDNATGNATFTGNALVGNGTAAAPSLTFASDTGTGMYRVGANSLGLSAGGALRVTVSTTALTLASTLTSLSAAQANVTANLLGLGGATADATNRFSINTPAVLLNNAGAGIDMTFNKNAAGNDASLSFKTAFSTQALFGLLGDNNITLKVGGSFLTAFYADPTTGRVVFPNSIRLDRSDDPASVANGALWYNTTGNRLKARIDGVTTLLGASEVPYLKPSTGRYIRAATTPGTTATNVTGVANRMSAYPFIPKYDFTCDRIGINCSTALAASNAKVAIYDSDDLGRPNQRLTETGDLDCSTTGAKEATVSFDFKEGKQYWIAVRFSSTQALSSFQPYTTPDLDSGSVSTSQSKTLTRTLTYETSAPASWGYSAAEASTAAAPIVWFRLA